METAEEFSEGLSLGAQMLMGHYCAGGSGNSSLITTALPDSISPPNFDDDYKKVISEGFKTIKVMLL